MLPFRSLLALALCALFGFSRRADTLWGRPAGNSLVVQGGEVLHKCHCLGSLGTETFRRV